MSVTPDSALDCWHGSAVYTVDVREVSEVGEGEGLLEGHRDHDALAGGDQRLDEHPPHIVHEHAREQHRRHLRVAARVRVKKGPLSKCEESKEAERFEAKQRDIQEEKGALSRGSECPAGSHGFKSFAWGRIQRAHISEGEEA